MLLDECGEHIDILLIAAHEIGMLVLNESLDDIRHTNRLVARVIEWRIRIPPSRADVLVQEMLGGKVAVVHFLDQEIGAGIPHIDVVVIGIRKLRQRGLRDIGLLVHAALDYSGLEMRDRINIDWDVRSYEHKGADRAQR